MNKQKIFIRVVVGIILLITLCFLLLQFIYSVIRNSESKYIETMPVVDFENDPYFNGEKDLEEL